MPPPPTLEERLRDAALAYARRLVALARAQSIDELAALDPRVAPTLEPVTSAWLHRRRRLKPRTVALADGGRKGRLPARLHDSGDPFVRSTTLSAAHALADFVAELPWPARSGDLRRLLVISKDRVRRAALVAIELGLIVRAGTKKTAMYSVGPRLAGGQMNEVDQPVPSTK